MADELFFVQPSVLERLISGQFIPKRQHSSTYRTRDRRNLLSPLNVVRKAIRYEPLVFSNRRENVIETVQILNQSYNRLVLISGPAGRGKTCFTRAIAEMMGGGKEQLLWFDVGRHTDFDEVVRFLIEYMTYICRSMGEVQEIPETQNPIETLEHLLRKAADFPILLVIDNVEYLVAQGQTIRSRELKEAFNFLLSFSNVKLILTGNQLPFADMNPAATAIHHLALDPLDETDSQALVKALFRDTALRQHDLSSIVPYFQGEPALLSLFAKLYERYTDFSAAMWVGTLELNPENPHQCLLNLVYDSLSETEKRILSVLSLMRHGITPMGLQSMVQHCYISLDTFDFKQLDHTTIRLLLKKVYPPQLVLKKLHHRNKEQEENQSIEPYYMLMPYFQELIQQKITEDEESRYHERLHDFYTLERHKHVLERTYQTRTRHLIAEAQYHHSRIRKRRTLLPVQESAFSEKKEALINPELLRRFEETPEEVAAAYDRTHPDETLPSVPPPDIPTLAVPIHMPAATPSLPPTVRLSDEDLEKLSELIVKADYRPKKAHSYVDVPRPVSQEAQNEPGALPSQTVMSGVELTSDLTDPKEQEALVRLNEAIRRHHRGEIAEALFHLAQNRLDKGLYQNAEQCLLKAAQFAKEEGILPLEVEVNTLLGHLCREQYQHNKALRYLREVQYLYEQDAAGSLGKLPLAKAYQDMGEIFFYRQDFEEALQAYRQCLDLRPPDESLKAEMLFKIALIYDKTEKFPAAIQYYQQSVEISTEARDDDAAAASLYNLGSLYFEQSKLNEARETIQNCLRHDHRVGRLRELFRTWILLSKIDEAQGQIEQARQDVQEALDVSQKEKNKILMATAYLRLGQLSEKLSAWDEAVRYYREAQQYGKNDLSEESLRMIWHRLKSLKEHPA
jgi:tetratricopeptide (TPR) repeat protein